MFLCSRLLEHTALSSPAPDPSLRLICCQNVAIERSPVAMSESDVQSQSPTTDRTPVVGHISEPRLEKSSDMDQRRPESRDTLPMVALILAAHDLDL